MRPMPKRASRGKTAEKTMQAKAKTISHLSIGELYCTTLW